MIRDRLFACLSAVRLVPLLAMAIAIGLMSGTAAHAAEKKHYYAGLKDSVPTHEYQRYRTTTPRSLVGGGGFAVSSWAKHWVINAAGAGYQLTTGWSTGGVVNFSHPRYYPAYSSCYFDFTNNTDPNTKVGVRCWDYR